MTGPATGPGVTGVPPGRRLGQLAELPVTVLRGVGGAAAADLAELGITTVFDLVTHYPRRYVDATRLVAIGQLVEGEKATVLATVTRVAVPPVRYGRGRGRPPARVELEVADSGAPGPGRGRMKVVFFNQTWRAKQLPVGTLGLFFGSVTSFRDALQMVSPMVEVLRGADEGADDGPDDDGGPASGRVYPVYPLTERASLTSARIGRMVHEALDRAGRFADPLPDGARRRFGLIDRTSAFAGIHRPRTMAETGPARRRLAFDELLRLQLALVLRRQRLHEDARGIRHAMERPDGSPTLVEQFVARLPFPLTGAQFRALADLAADLGGPLPMHRLLQGDVGSGKTVVAVAAMLMGVEGGHQGALMAPTEVLAEQHATEVRRLVEGLEVADPTTLEGRRPLRVGLLTSRTGAADRAAVHAGLADGTVDVAVGTHALLTDRVVFRSLGVVVIDEQHRFGVEQRAALRDKGRGEDGTGSDPDLLVMTATPIPRTAAMVVFGDLDMTVVDELPPGRQPVSTSWLRTPLEAETAWSRVREQVASGHRAFVVCPLVEGSDRVEAASVTAEAERLATEELRGLRVGLLHGQMRPAEKEQAMESFRTGDLDVLVATTVIEVGVDVPDASVMVIEDADRFGIAQLHQLRGRVGRGGEPAWCYLLSESDAPEPTARLTAMEETSDGFVLADVDLELRGEGTILGARQKGRSDLKLARLLTDRDLVVDARSLAVELVEADPRLDDHRLLVEELRLFVDEDEAGFLFKS
ncbi:MAG: ATP-dependent DNA helicase RecG [Acidimicrobiales bacterium]